jgi:hypothetical protein
MQHQHPSNDIQNYKLTFNFILGNLQMYGMLTWFIFVASL